MAIPSLQSFAAINLFNPHGFLKDDGVPLSIKRVVCNATGEAIDCRRYSLYQALKRAGDHWDPTQREVYRQLALSVLRKGDLEKAIADNPLMRLFARERGLIDGSTASAK